MKFRKYKLADVCNIQIGKTPRRDVKEYWGKGYSWLSISDMKSDVITTTKEEITESAVKKCGCKLILEGTILLSFKLSIGKIAFAGKDLFTNEAIVGLEIKDRNILHPAYLFYVLKNIPLIGSNNAAMGATLNKESLKILQLPVPETISDQLHIANILTKAENLISQRKQSIALLDEFLKSTFLEMFGDPVSNEKAWKTKTIEQLVKKEKYSLKRGPFGGALKKEIFVTSGYLVYEQYHALNNDFLFARYFIDERKFNELKGFEVKPGDIIISCSGVYLGKLAIVPQGARKGIINQALLKISLDLSIVNSIFFVNVFSNENFKRKYYGNDIGSGIPNFPSMDDFKKFLFIYPPIELQTRFAQIVEKTETLKAQYQSSMQELENLYGSLSQRAFRGELTMNSIN